ncbi:hypothetical protein V8D89_007928 [Ganoderma adspersum]
MSPITLPDNESVLSLHTFIFSDEPARASYIYGLKLPDPYAYEVQVIDRSIFDDRLVAILEAAVHIQYLHIPTSIMDPVFDAVMKLPTLREFHAVSQDTGRPLRRRLNTLRSPLRSICIEACDPGGDNISAFFLHRHLSHLAPTLEALDLDFFLLDIPPSFITTQFAVVRSLKFQADYISFDFHPMAILLHLFPNLDDTLVLGPFTTTFADDEFAALRARSEEEQKAHAWPGLDRLVCDAEWAFVYALQCPVRRMDIHVPRARGNWCLSDTLRSNPPRHLHLSVKVSSREGWGVLDGLLPLEAADRLTHLVIVVEFEVRRKWRAYLKRKRIPWSRLLDRVLDSVRHLRLTHLRIVLDCTVLQGVPYAFPHGDLANTECEPDLQPIASRFMDTMSALDCLFLEARGRTYAFQWGLDWMVERDQTADKWLSSNAWQVVRDTRDEPLPPSGAKSARSWTELSGEAAERIADREELDVFRAGEVRCLLRLRE